MCYIGTPLSNLAHLVSVERCGENGDLHLPIPQIHPIVSWKPGSDLLEPRTTQHVPHDLSSFPVQEVRDALVEAFFNEINPGFPVVDESEFRRCYEDVENPPPLLLYQAILLAGAHVCQHPKVLRSRSLVKGVLFKRAKALWDLRFENDRVTLVQAALIFSWHVENVDNVSANSYYWISVACSIAHGLGMHRNLNRSAGTVMPLFTRHLCRRLWWTLFQAAVLSAIDHGRPLVVQPDEADQPHLEEEDLVEIDGLVNKKICLQYCVQNSTLCEIMADIIKMHSPGSLRRNGRMDTRVIDSRLAAWLMALPSGSDFYTLQLRMNYNIALLHLHRTEMQNGKPYDFVHSTKLCGGAAETIVSILNSMTRAGEIRMCYLSGLTAVMAVAIHITREIHLAIGQHSMLLVLQAQSQLEGLFPIMTEMAHYWPTAKATLKLFQHVLERSKTTMVVQTNSNPNLETLITSDHDFPTANWDLICSTLHANATELDWSNSESWLRV